MAKGAVRSLWSQRAFAALAILILSGSPASAQDSAQPVVILDQKVILTDQQFAVRKTGTVRTRPTTKGERLGYLRKGDPVQVLGAAVGTAWYAVARDDEPWGFIYREALIPVLDGSLRQPLNGEAIGLKGACRYTIAFAGRNQVNGDAIQSVDYDLTLSCGAVERPNLFRGFMFLIEMPYDMSHNPVFQINVDLIDLDDEYEPPSAVILYDQRTDKLRLDGVYPDQWAQPSAAKERDAKTVKEALMGSVSLAVSAWNEAVWAALEPR